MTRNDSLLKTAPLGETIDRAIATYGAFPVLIRALVAAIRPNRPPPLPDADNLPAHLRRDLNLPVNQNRTRARPLRYY